MSTGKRAVTGSISFEDAACLVAPAGQVQCPLVPTSNSAVVIPSTNRPRHTFDGYGERCFSRIPSRDRPIRYRFASSLSLIRTGRARNINASVFTGKGGQYRHSTEAVPQNIPGSGDGSRFQLAV